ncbi:MAG: amidohydrolase family protein [Acidobacteriia bacterium]|nr:amidohydrolase family protein [Terriglobia bacterium]
MDFDAIDLHVHITNWRMLRPEMRETMRRTQKQFEEALSACDDPRVFLRLMDEAGIERAGLINYVSPDLLGFTFEVNEWVSRYARQQPDRFIAFGSVHPHFTTDPAAEMDLLCGRLGIRAIKVHPPHQFVFSNEYVRGEENLRIIYAKAQDFGVPVTIHTGTSIFPGARNKFANPMDIDDVAIDFPRLKILIAHGGRPLYMNESFFLVRRFQNVYLEISGIPPLKLLEYFPRLEEIADKTVYGSDWPGPGVPSLKAVLDQFKSLPISDSAKRKILRENALKIFP